MTTFTPPVCQYLDVQRADRVVTARLNRPDARNALNEALMLELAETLARADAAQDVGCVVLAGDDACFCAGADIAELAAETPASLAQRDPIARWNCVAQTRKPIIAAVGGYALGGGLELALMCDLIIAGETARFAFPEVGLGLAPGAGGVQRMMRAVGKAQAMALLLTGRRFSAQDAFSMGLISEVVADADVRPRSQALAASIANQPLTATLAIKAAARQAFEAPLAVALEGDRERFHLLFATQDAREGLTAFRERRAPVFRHC